MRVVLDTNVLLAAFAAHGLCEAVFEVCLTSHQIVLSEHIITELQRHLRSKLRMPAEQITEIVSFLRTHAEWVTPELVQTDTCRDPADLPVLGTAGAARADCLVTGDHDLLVLDSFQGTAILSPRAFHERVR